MRCTTEVCTEELLANPPPQNLEFYENSEILCCTNITYFGHINMSGSSFINFICSNFKGVEGDFIGHPVYTTYYALPLAMTCSFNV